MKRTISIILAVVMCLSTFVVGTVSSASAKSNKTVKITVKEQNNAKAYVSRTAYMQEVRKGKSFYAKEFSKRLSRTFAFTLTDDAYCMINWGFKDKGTSNSVKVYYDADLMNEVEVDKIWTVPNNQNNALYTQDTLAKGTYYVRVENRCKGNNSFKFYVGTVSKKNSKTFFNLTAKVNSNNSVTYTVNCPEEVTEAYLYVYYKKRDFYITKLNDNKVYLTNKKFTYTNSKNDEHSRLNIGFYDIYGYEHFDSYLMMNPRTATVKGVKTLKYTGKNVTQKARDLSVDVSTSWSLGDTFPATFNCSYKNNKNVGIATITFTGKDHTLGSFSKTFNIVPNNIKCAKSSVRGSKATLSWSKSNGAKKYVLQKKVKNKYVTVKTLSNTSYKLSVAKGRTYFRVYGTATVGGKNYNGSAKTFSTYRK